MAKRIWRNFPRFDKFLLFIFSAVAVSLVVAGFLFPPKGEVHDSVLIAVGELFVFPALGALIHGIDEGINLAIKKGDMEIKVNKDDD